MGTVASRSMHESTRAGLSMGRCTLALSNGSCEGSKRRRYWMHGCKSQQVTVTMQASHVPLAAAVWSCARSPHSRAASDLLRAGA